MKTDKEMVNEFMANNKVTKVKPAMFKDFKVRYTFRKPSAFKVREHLLALMAPVANYGTL